MEMKPIGIKVKRNNNMKTIQKKPKQGVNSNIEKGKVPGLPKDFFETVLDCEVKLKQKFDMKVLQKLIDYYSTAVGYYESINDPKYMIYNQSLSLLFAQPEVKQYLSGGNLKLKLKKENIQKIIQECDKKVTSDKVKNFIRRKSTADSKKTINKLINKDMETQSNDFKKRLAEKKKRYKLSTSDMAGNDEIGRAFKNMGLNTLNNNENKNNKSIDLPPEKEFVFSDKDVPLVNNEAVNTENKNVINDKGSSNNNIPTVEGNSNTNILDELKKEDLDEENKEKNNNGEENNNLNDSFENKLDYNLETANNSRKQTITNKNIKFTNKTKFLEKMKLHFDIYSNDYYDHFIKKITDQIVKDYNANFNELTQTLMDSAVNYINQEKEMEFLLNTDSDESYKKEINLIVQQLKDEDNMTKEKLISENKAKIEELNDKYMGTLNTIQSGHDLEMLKERFKLDTTKSLNTLVFK
jgi:hypothetical protein